jgi:hypothetical protein
VHPLIELALELITDDGEEWGYYFADHDKRIIFWFEDHESRPLMNKVRGVECKSHISEFFLRRSFYSNFCNCVASRVCTRSAILVRTTSSMPVPSHDRSTMHSHFIPVLLTSPDLHTMILLGDTSNYFQTNASFRKMSS